MSYLVTGGTGFIGSQIARLLVKEGETVVTYDNNRSQALLERILSPEEMEKVTVIHGDVTDLPHLMRTVQDHKVDKIIHMAYILSREAYANPPLAVKVNCDGTMNVLETARILKLKKVVWASSLSVFGAREKYDQEYTPNDAPHFPEGIYGACKNHNELITEYYFNEYKVDTVGIRFGMVYGPGQASGASGMLTRELMVNPALGKPGKVPWADDILNFVYVEDAARSAVLASKAPPTRTRTFNMDGDFRPMTEAIACVKKLIPGADITALPGYTRFPSKYDPTRIREEVGYKPEWPIEKGIKAVIDDVRSAAG